MNVYRLSMCISLLMLILNGCYKEPEFPAEPTLVGKPEVQFKEGTDDGSDSLRIKVKFQDGDGDLGLSGSGADVEYPYQLLTVKTDNNGQAIKYNRNDPGLPPYNCNDYYTIEDALSSFNGVPLDKGDTLWVEYNKNYRNFDMRLLVRQSNGEYEPFDSGCILTLSGRFPRLKQSYEDTTPREGTIEYSAASKALLLLFRNDTLKVEVQIRDRALHESNIVESDPFTLRGVQIN